MEPPPTPEKTIPLIDIRHTGPVGLVRQYDHLAKALLLSSRGAFGRVAEIASYAAFPVGDFMARHWLEKTNNPYYSHIRDIAGIIGEPGIYALNLSYEWGCTTGIEVGEESCQLLRTLDWPFPGLGEHLVVCRENGIAGDYYNITWPGLVGVFTAMAPSRFSLAINQAPVLQKTGNVVADWMLNRLGVKYHGGLPPAHLARYVCEHAENYDKALEMLIHTPICMPAIFTLTGIHPHEGCIVERQEKEAYLRPLTSRGEPLSTANHWVVTPTALPWKPREPDSYGRKGQMDSHLESGEQQEDFAWLEFPVLNDYTRLATVMNAATGTIRLQGFAGKDPCTALFVL